MCYSYSYVLYIVYEKKKLIEARKQDRERVLSSAISERDSAERAYQELLETSRQIQQMIRSQSGRRGGGVSGTGVLMWPTAATIITSPYGTRTHPIFGTTHYHSGIDIGADYGDTVVAADSGTVIYSTPVLFSHMANCKKLYRFLNSVICEWLAWTKSRLGITGTNFFDFTP